MEKEPDDSGCGVDVHLPLPFRSLKLWAHEQWVAWQTVERWLTDDDCLTDTQLRLTRSIVIGLIEKGAIILNGLHEEILHRNPLT